MRAIIAVLSGFCLFVAIPTVEAWNAAGHMVSASIAYANLKERNPTLLAKVIKLLKQHPQFESKWSPKLEHVSADDRDLYLLMLAARWPDDIRKNTKYDHHDWHYVNIPYRPGEGGETIPEEESIITAYAENRSILKSAGADDKAQAVALCWVLHLIGDVHQPLHTTKLVTSNFPEPIGDRGGTRFYIRVWPGSSTISLHKLWDDLILGSAKFQAVQNKSIKLRSEPDLKRDNFTDQLLAKSFNDWAVAAHKIAIEQVYRNGALDGSANKDDGAVLPEDYTTNAKEIAERQIVLSGYRISDGMVHVFGK